MKDAVFVDVDGVLLDVSRRYFALHCAIARRLGEPIPSREDYWADVRSAAAPFSERSSAYRKLWLADVESEDYLALDRPIPGAVEALARLAQAGGVAAVTLRRRRARLEAQLAAFGFVPHLCELVNGRREGEAPWRAKARLMRASRSLRRARAVAGDTETEIRAGRELGLRTVGVLSGLRSRQRLEAERPDAVIETVAELPAALEMLPR